MPASDSTIARIELARQSEEEVLAESGFHGERTVAVVRVAVAVLRGLSTFGAGAVAHIASSANPLRTTIGLSYVGYGLVVVWGLWRPSAKPKLTAARTAPFVFNLIDFSINVVMGMIAFRLGEGAHMDRAAITIATVLCFSVARFSPWQVVQGAVMACVSFLIMIWFERGPGVPFDWPSMVFIEANLIGLGILIWRTNLRLRRMFVDLRRRDNLQRFLPAPVAKRLIEHGELALQPVQREVTVLFVDIRDFTTLSETMAPREVLQLLDEFFGHLSQIVKGRDGIVNKFLGDGMLAFWGVPERDDRHAEKALAAVLDIRREVAEINAQRANETRPIIRIGMGLHSGPVAAGMLGGADQHEYTIIGDAVNVASRVEGLTKLHSVDALVSESTWKLSRGLFKGGKVAEDKVKGRQETVVVYSVLERIGPDEQTASAAAS